MTKKTTVIEELEYWNIIYILRRLNIYYRDHLRYKIKDLQGLESNDFAMQVIEKIISESRPWENSSRTCFMDFVYDVAWDELSHFIRDNKEKRFISYNIFQDRLPTNRIKDNYYGF